VPTISPTVSLSYVPHLFSFVSGDSFFVSGQCRVVADGFVIQTDLDFPSAVEILFSTYYVFNVAYPECSAASLEFIQRLVF